MSENRIQQIDERLNEIGGHKETILGKGGYRVSFDLYYGYSATSNDSILTVISDDMENAVFLTAKEALELLSWLQLERKTLEGIEGMKNEQNETEAQGKD